MLLKFLTVLAWMFAILLTALTVAAFCIGIKESKANDEREARKTLGQAWMLLMLALPPWAWVIAGWLK